MLQHLSCCLPGLALQNSWADSQVYKAHRLEREYRSGFYVPHPPNSNDKFCLIMCYYITYNVKYKGCTEDPKHLNSTTKYDKCPKAKQEGSVCTDATPAEDSSGKVIQFGNNDGAGDLPKVSFVRHTNSPSLVPGPKQ